MLCPCFGGNKSEPQRTVVCGFGGRATRPSAFLRHRIHCGISPPRPVAMAPTDRGKSASLSLACCLSYSTAFLNFLVYISHQTKLIRGRGSLCPGPIPSLECGIMLAHSRSSMDNHDLKHQWRIWGNFPKSFAGLNVIPIALLCPVIFPVLPENSKTYSMVWHN